MLFPVHECFRRAHAVGLVDAAVAACEYGQRDQQGAGQGARNDVQVLHVAEVAVVVGVGVLIRGRRQNERLGCSKKGENVN